jgi:hypothetical protein
MDAPTATLLASTLSTLGIALLNYFREGRIHRWAQDAREEDRAEHERTTSVISEKIDQAQEQIAKGTDAAAAAYDVGNHINDKLLAIGQVRVKDGEALKRRAEDDA